MASWTMWTRMSVFRSLVVVSGCGICSAGFTGFAPRAVFLPVFVRPLMLGIMAGINQRDSSVSRWSSTSLLWCRCSFRGTFTPEPLGVFSVLFRILFLFRPFVFGNTSPVPQVAEETVEVVRLARRERVQQWTAEQIVVLASGCRKWHSVVQ